MKGSQIISLPVLAAMLILLALLYQSWNANPQLTIVSLVLILAVILVATACAFVEQAVTFANSRGWLGPKKTRSKLWRYGKYGSIAVPVLAPFLLGDKLFEFIVGTDGKYLSGAINCALAPMLSTSIDTTLACSDGGNLGNNAATLFKLLLVPLALILWTLIWRLKDVNDVESGIEEVRAKVEHVSHCLAEAAQEGLRLMPYGANRNRFFFHVDVQSPDLDPKDEKCDLTLDVIFSGPTFHAKDYLLSTEYLRYFFWRREHAIPGKACRVFIFDERRLKSLGEGSDHDLLVLINMSALSGYRTYLMPPTIYETIVNKIHELSGSGGKTPSKAKIREILQGHPGWTVKKGACASSPIIEAKYLPPRLATNMYGRVLTETIHSPMNELILRVLLDDACKDDARVNIGKDINILNNWKQPQYVSGRLAHIAEVVTIDLLQPSAISSHLQPAAWTA